MDKAMLPRLLPQGSPSDRGQPPASQAIIPVNNESTPRREQLRRTAEKDKFLGGRLVGARFQLETNTFHNCKTGETHRDAGFRFRNDIVQASLSLSLSFSACPTPGEKSRVSPMFPFKNEILSKRAKRSSELYRNSIFDAGNKRSTDFTDGNIHVCKAVGNRSSHQARSIPNSSTIMRKIAGKAAIIIIRIDVVVCFYKQTYLPTRRFHHIPAAFKPPSIGGITEP